MRNRRSAVTPYINAGVIALAIVYAAWVQHDRAAAPPDAKPPQSIGSTLERWDQASAFQRSVLLPI